MAAVCPSLRQLQLQLLLLLLSLLLSCSSTEACSSSHHQVLRAPASAAPGVRQQGWCLKSAVTPARPSSLEEGQRRSGAGESCQGGAGNSAA